MSQNHQNKEVKILKDTKNSFKEKIISRNKSDVFRTQSSIVKLKKLIKFYPKTKLDNGMKKFIYDTKQTNITKQMIHKQIQYFQ